MTQLTPVGLNNLWLWSTFIFCLIAWIKWQNSYKCSIIRRPNHISIPALIYCIIFIFIVGFRFSPSGTYVEWADSSLYAHKYVNKFFAVDNINQVQLSHEWLFDYINNIFFSAGADVSYFFFFCDLLYMCFIWWGIRQFFPNNQWLALLFYISSFSFLSYSINGIRNGIACSMMITALSFLITKKPKDLIIGGFIAFLAMGFHRSVALPIISAIAALFLKKDCNWALGWWCFSILLSLIFGNMIQDMFANMGFDDRLQNYASTSIDRSKDAHKFSSTGFRWDFIIYSALPIALYYIISIRQKIYDARYVILMNTYIISNSFWIMVIRANFSNRFAYLSWFLQPIVIAYPLLRMYVWRDQNRQIVKYLMLYIGFTLFLNIVIW